MSQQLDYCAVRSLVGRDLADEMFGRKIPSGIDIDFVPDQDMAEVIAKERFEQDVACSGCKDNVWCDP